MKFKCNNMTYEIIEDSRETLDKKYKEDFPDSEYKIYFGYTSYTEHKIVLNKDLNKEEKIKTLKHELAHCWLHNYGHTFSEYGEEDVCEIVACSNDFINEIVRQYLGIRPLYLCNAENNIECKKKSCYINDGVCCETSNIKYAKRVKVEH